MASCTSALPAVSPPPPDLFTILARSLVACVLAEAVFIGALVASGWTLPALAWAYGIGWGLGAGAALAVAEAALRRFGVVVALMVGVCLSPLAPLGGEFELEFVHWWSVEWATDEALYVLEQHGPGAWSAFAGGALFVYGPLLVALRRRASPRGQALAMIAGALLWALIYWTVAPWSLSFMVTWRVAPLCLLVPALVVPPGRRLGDRLAQVVRRAGARPPARERRSRGRRAQLVALALVALATSLALCRAPERPIEDARGVWRAIHLSEPALMIKLGDRHTWGDFGDDLLSWRPSPTPPSASAALGREDVGWGGTEVAWGRDASMHALSWYARAAVLGAPRALERIRMLPFVEEEPEVLAWLRQAAAGGDADAALELGLRLLRPSVGAWHPEPELDQHRDSLGPGPGTRDRAVVEDAREGLRWLRHATDLGGARARLHLQRALRAAPSATTVEALARLAEAEWRVPTLPTWWRVRERRAIARARAALAVGSGPTRGGDRP